MCANPKGPNRALSTTSGPRPSSWIPRPLLPHLNSEDKKQASSLSVIYACPLSLFTNAGPWGDLFCLTHFIRLRGVDSSFTNGIFRVFTRFIQPLVPRGLSISISLRVIIIDKPKVKED